VAELQIVPPEGTRTTGFIDGEPSGGMSCDLVEDVMAPHREDDVAGDILRLIFRSSRVREGAAETRRGPNPEQQRASADSPTLSAWRRS
jgi:hypothetical protein